MYESTHICCILNGHTVGFCPPDPLFPCKQSKCRRRGKRSVCQPAVLLSSCCRPHFWSKLTGFQNRFHLMWNPFALTARWKFLSPQLLLQKLVLWVVSRVTKTLPIVNGTCMIENTSGAGRGLFPINFLSVFFLLAGKLSIHSGSEKILNWIKDLNKLFLKRESILQL